MKKNKSIAICIRKRNFCIIK